MGLYVQVGSFSECPANDVVIHRTLIPMDSISSEFVSNSYMRAACVNMGQHGGSKAHLDFKELSNLNILYMNKKRRPFLLTFCSLARIGSV